jgi:hypothetical protein
MPLKLKITSVGHELVVSCGSLLEIVESYRSPLLCAVAFEGHYWQFWKPVENCCFQLIDLEPVANHDFSLWF